jgi:SET domain-containing protein
MDSLSELEEYFYVERSQIHGNGLFARVVIEAGEWLGTYDSPETNENGTYVLWVEDEQGRWLGRDGKNLLRYINHSDSPCAEFADYDLYATRRIEPHEEITIDYGDEFFPDAE